MPGHAAAGCVVAGTRCAKGCQLRSPVAAEYHADAAPAGPAARLPTGIPQPNNQAQARRPPIRRPARTTGSKTIWRMARTRDSCRNGGSRPRA
ncbi:hypothetical protein CBM2587_A50114 [Cupriavidus taiwanensis]|uniref:Uncharacterized protein n=1 Tax=Cupriavidus taiwanensis TaxID=164546 RepID=A0A375BVG9_9BURK|nr:hypothetical protein CBM2587_A50114 [Cupriavidus taiwanensis]